MHCRFCQSSELVPKHRGLSHPKLPDHGPFDLYVCRDCGSLVTWPVPAADALDRLYAAMDCGVEKLVVLSTDKAAYPVNAMGCSKMMMEKIIAVNDTTGEITHKLKYVVGSI